MKVSHLQAVLKNARREMFITLTVRQLQVFLEVADNPGISVGEVADNTDMSMAAASHCLSQLISHGKAAESDKRGLGLIKMVEDPRERRRKNLVLTKKGEKVLRALFAR